MSFWLPTPAQLSAQQREIINSDLSGYNFITGPAGSGKTVVGIYKLKELVSAGRTRVLYLMYNHSLYGFIKNGSNSINLSNVFTKDSFLWKLHYAITRRLIDWGRNSYEDVYEGILLRLLSSSNLPSYDLIIIDECQDLNSLEVQLLKKMSKNIMFLGDFHQSVYKNRIRFEELGVQREIRLRKIYRYGAKILDFAKLFSTDSNFHGAADLIAAPKPNETVYLHIDDHETKGTILALIEKYQREKKRVALLTPVIAQLSSFSSNLRTFSGEGNKELQNFNFDLPVGLTVVNSKGLEFDAVIVFGFDREIERSISQKPTEMAYVGCTRARTNLHFFINEKTIGNIRTSALNANKSDVVFAY